MTQLSQDVTTFLVGMGIPLEDQHPDYRLEIAYRMGYADGVRNYAIWKDGEMLVGALQRPLAQVMQEFAKSDVPVRY